jgi:Fe-S cluster assembly scaffold protein SufB
MNELFLEKNVQDGSLVLDEDSSIRTFQSNLSDGGKHRLEIHVRQNISLNFTYVDFSKVNMDFELNVILEKGASATISLASIGFEDFKKVFRFNVEHKDPNTYSRVSMSGINTGNGCLTFLGNSLIPNGSHHSDTRQEGRITNLSPDCHSEVSPSLLIKENDVQASHGAALGAYDPTQIFYLMSRGLSMMEAKRLITYGTLYPIIESLSDEEVIKKAKNALEELDI